MSYAAAMLTGKDKANAHSLRGKILGIELSDQ